MSKADCDVNRIRGTHKLHEQLLDSGAYIDRERLRCAFVIAHQERAELLAEIERLEAEDAARCGVRRQTDEIG